MKISVSKEVKFHAAHHDNSAPDEDPCGRVHGHTYTLRMTVCTTSLDDRGMVVHGDELKKFYREKIEPLVEHQDLNQTLDFNPTMEAVTLWIGKELSYYFANLPPARGLKVKVRLYETPTMFCEAEGNLYVEGRF